MSAFRRPLARSPLSASISGGLTMSQVVFIAVGEPFRRFVRVGFRSSSRTRRGSHGYDRSCHTALLGQPTRRSMAQRLLFLDASIDPPACQNGVRIAMHNRPHVRSGRSRSVTRRHRRWPLAGYFEPIQSVHCTQAGIRPSGPVAAAGAGSRLRPSRHR
jgi:hypothetical protein